MMAILSTAWVVPGLAGPAISAEVAHLFGWRWVFLGLLPFIALTGPFAIPALVKLGRPEAKATEGHRLIDGVGVAAAAGLVLGGLTLAAGSSSTVAGGAARTGCRAGRPLLRPASHPVAAVARAAGRGFSGRDLAIVAGGVLILAGLALGVPLLRRLMPPGTLRARYGLPATIASRSLLTFAFFGADAFVTLTITILRHYTPVVAGIAVTGSTLAWTTGAWFQAKMNGKWPGRRFVRIGLSIILAGIAGLTLLLSSRVSVVEGIAAWTVAGLGMGLSYSPITLLMMQAAPAGGEGWASASLNLADVLGSAMGIGIGGALISAAVTLGWSLAVGLATAFALTAASRRHRIADLQATARHPAAAARRGPRDHRLKSAENVRLRRVDRLTGTELRSTRPDAAIPPVPPSVAARPPIARERTYRPWRRLCHPVLTSPCTAGPAVVQCRPGLRLPLPRQRHTARDSVWQYRNREVPSNRMRSRSNGWEVRSNRWEVLPRATCGRSGDDNVRCRMSNGAALPVDARAGRPARAGGRARSRLAAKLPGLAIDAKVAPVARTRSSGASSTSRPRWPALQKTVSNPVAEESMTTGRTLRWAIGEMPPVT